MVPMNSSTDMPVRTVTFSKYSSESIWFRAGAVCPPTSATLNSHTAAVPATAPIIRLVPHFMLPPMESHVGRTFSWSTGRRSCCGNFIVACSNIIRSS